MGVFDNYSSGEMLPIIKNAELENVPFQIESMRYRENVQSEYGVKNQIKATVRIEETGERFTYFAENTVVLSKLLWLITSGTKYDGVVFILKKTKSANTNEYWDILEYEVAAAAAAAVNGSTAPSN